MSFLSTAALAALAEVQGEIDSDEYAFAHEILVISSQYAYHIWEIGILKQVTGTW